MNKPVLLLLVLLIATVACAHKGQHHGGGHRPHDGNPHKGQHHPGGGEGHGPHDGQHHPGGGKGNHHHDGEHKPHHNDGHQDSCTYTNSKGEEFDFRALTSYLKDQDWKLISSETRSVFHFNPCGHVRVKACPSNSSLCEITKDGKAISFGSVHQAMWADGESSGATVEITYGGGDMCSNGVTRKTVVDLKCEEFAVEEGARPSHVVAVHEEECMVKLLIESPYACPKADVCSFLKDSKSCHNTDGMCSWRHDACTARRNWFRDFTLKHHLTNPVIFTLLVSGSFVTSCLLATCMCCLCKKRNNRAKIVAKKNKVESCKLQDFKQMDHAVVSIPTEAPYLYQPMQAVNGENSFFVPPVATGYPAAAYSYPMVQMVPAHLLHHQQQQMDAQKQQH